MKSMPWAFAAIAATLLIGGCPPINISGVPGEQGSSESSKRIIVTFPNSSTVWTHGQLSTYVEWSGSEGDRVRVELYKNGEFLDHYHGWTANDGHVDLTGEPILSTWGSGTDYQIKVIDDLGRSGLSDRFEISGANLITVSYPDSSTVWTHGQMPTYVEWSGSFGDRVRVELYKGERFVDSYHGWTDNDGHVDLSGEPIQPGWGIGTDFRVKVVDDLADFGWSAEFEIRAASGGGTIDVTYPDSSTVWTHGQMPTYVEWSGSAGSQVRVEIHKGGAFLDDYHGWTANDGHVDLSGEPIQAAWGTGTDFQIKVIDDLDAWGLSEHFEIRAASGGGTINVTYPDSSTVWTHGQMPTYVEWSGSAGSQVRAEIHKDGEFLDDYHGWTANDGHVDLSGEPIPASWGTGTDYQIKVIDDLNAWGMSDNFEIRAASGGGTIDVTYPDSSTVWTHGQKPTHVSWNGSQGTQVRVELWKGGQFVDHYHPWTANDGHVNLSGEPVEPGWGTGTDYRIKVIDDLDAFGFSDEFEIRAP